MELTKYNIDTRFLPFKFTAIAWHEVDDKIDLLDLKVALNSNIKISDYGNNITSIFFIFVADYDPAFHPEHIAYSEEKHEIFMQIHLPFRLVQEYEEAQVMQLMATLYVKAMQTHLPTLTIPDFNYQRFIKDVKILFKAQGWLVAEYMRIDAHSAFMQQPVTPLKMDRIEDVDISKIPDLQKSFSVSSVVHPFDALSDKMDEVNLLESVLNKNIQLSDYGAHVKHIWVGVFCTDLESEDTEEFVRFVPKDQVISMVFALHEPAVVEATLEDIHHLTAIAFLAWLHTKPLEALPDFNLPALRADVKKLFATRGWTWAALKEDYKVGFEWKAA